MAVQSRSAVIGGEELRRKLAALSAALAEESLGAALTAGADLVVNAAKQRAPYRTGTLRRAIHSRVTASRDEATAEIGVHQDGEGAIVPYAAQVEFGGTIVPRTAKALHWVDKDGNEHFARSVTQPARPYLRPAFDEQADNALAETAAALRELIKAVTQ